MYADVVAVGKGQGNDFEHFPAGRPPTPLHWCATSVSTAKPLQLLSYILTAEMLAFCATAGPGRGNAGVG